jgi:hypothetical protein
MLFRLTAYTSSSPRTCHHPLSPDLHNSQLVRYPVGFGKPFQQVASWTTGSHNRQQTAMPWFGLDFRQYCPANNPLEYFTLCLTKVLVLPTHNRELRAGELRSVNAHYFDINQLLTAIITFYFFRLDRPSYGNTCSSLWLQSRLRPKTAGISPPHRYEQLKLCHEVVLLPHPLHRRLGGITTH